jgi:MFS family permease
MKRYFHNMSFTSPATPAPQPTTQWRDVWVAAASNAITGMGTFLVMTTLILTLQEEGHGGLAVSGVIMAEALPVVVLVSLTGRLADRIDSRLLLVAAGAVQVAACWALSTADGLPARIGLLILVCCGTAVVLPTRQALMMTMATRDDLPRASGIAQTASQIGSIAGPALAGFAQGSLGSATTLKAAACAFGATIVAGLLIRTRRGGTVAAAEQAAVAGKVRMDELLRVLTIGFAVVVGAVAAVNVVDVFFVKATLGASSSAYGLITSMWTLGMIAGTWIAARYVRRMADDGRVVVASMFTMAGTSALILIVSLMVTVWPVVGLNFAGGILNGAINVLVFTVFGRRAPAHARGRISARLQAAVQGAALLGYAAGGLALEAWTPRFVLAAGSVAGIVAAFGVLPWVFAAAKKDRQAGQASTAAIRESQPATVDA